jgi:hypothetical protein
MNKQIKLNIDLDNILSSVDKKLDKVRVTSMHRKGDKVKLKVAKK